ncbi:transposase [Candidatus Thiomargarita nelsonii]|uniref:Transposase n=1 Tax=Candidatus Thiomargarita nelsonii TaxID=1003181 RepID=A0A176S7M6_9GAMM|nr:transposase [Candidatus Thiomargarita nelsonii]
MTKELTGKLFGDKGYIFQKITKKLLEGGLQLITPLKKNMQNKLIPILDKILYRSQHNYRSRM